MSKVSWAGGLVLLGLFALHSSGVGARDRSMVDDLDRVDALAPAGGAQVAEPDGLFDGELARDFHDAEPLGKLVDRNQRHDGTRDDVYGAVGSGPLGVGPDDEEVGYGSHGSFLWCGRLVVVY